MLGGIGFRQFLVDYSSLVRIIHYIYMSREAKNATSEKNFFSEFLTHFVYLIDIERLTDFNKFIRTRPRQADRALLTELSLGCSPFRTLTSL